MPVPPLTSKKCESGSRAAPLQAARCRSCTYSLTAGTQLKAKLKAYRKGIAPDGVIWVSWPKKSSGVPTMSPRT